ncbi:MAG: hypothetical protein LBC94_09725 [Desulfovibrio sp.]|jgi:hypothetical protein|nr:hypothetical protein [Desulfovibrio sp.]
MKLTFIFYFMRRQPNPLRFAAAASVQGNLFRSGLPLKMFDRSARIFKKSAPRNACKVNLLRRQASISK